MRVHLFIGASLMCALSRLICLLLSLSLLSHSLQLPSKQRIHENADLVCEYNMHQSHGMFCSDEDTPLQVQPQPPVEFLSFRASQSEHQIKVGHLHCVPRSLLPLGPSGRAHIQKLRPWLEPFFFVSMVLHGSS